VNDLSPEAQQMREVLGRVSGWVDWQVCVPSATDPSIALMYSNELARHGYKIERRGSADGEAFRLMRP
jgi:hypothetical protein